MSSLVYLLFSLLVVTAHCNLEVDILNKWKNNLIDPNSVLASWDPTLVNPCTWFHVTCNSDNKVVRLDLGRANLSGILVPQLGRLTNLQYLEVYGNYLSGSIPSEFGGLRHLISLDLYNNNLTGLIPASLANLRSLTYLRLNGNSLSGRLPDKVLLLVQLGKLRILDVSDNQLIGTLHNHTNKSVTKIIQDAKA